MSMCLTKRTDVIRQSMSVQRSLVALSGYVYCLPIFSKTSNIFSNFDTNITTINVGCFTYVITVLNKIKSLFII